MRKKKRKYTRRKPKQVLPLIIDPNIGSIGWCKDLTLVAQAQEFFKNPIFLNMYSILVNERPAKSALRVDSTMPTLAAAQMFSTGYEYCLEKLISFQHHIQDKKQEEPTFTEEE